jgi:hypothetical protein
MDWLDRDKKSEINSVWMYKADGKDDQIEALNEKIVDLIKEFRELKNGYILFQ